jgi:hypothetical protein
MSTVHSSISGMRYLPSVELLQKVVDAFMPQQKLTESFDIYLNRINEEKVIKDITSIFPEIELIYYPSKINSILKINRKAKKCSVSSEDTTIVFTFETCVLILRQFLRSRDFIVKTKSLKRKDTVNRIMSIIPPLCRTFSESSNTILTHSDGESDI